MRKAGWIMAAAGSVPAIILLLVQGSAWFHTQQLKTMSETVELITSAFWALVLLSVAGLLLFLSSFSEKHKRKRQEAELAAIPEPPSWLCACCGAENPGEAELCQICGMPYGSEPEGEAFRADNWICPDCGRVQPDSAATCSACGYNRFGDYE